VHQQDEISRIKKEKAMQDVKEEHQEKSINKKISE
jgi:hypothetical protein